MMVYDIMMFAVAVLALLAGPAIAWTPNFAHAGALVSSGLESSPLYYRGRLLLMQSQMGRFGPDNESHSFFCLNDLVTGEVLVCPPSSSGHAFCSAIVDSTPGRNETLWVFCSAWDRASRNCTAPGTWGCGACSDPAGGCYVGSWACSGDDVAACDWTFGRALTMPGKETVPNVGVGLVPAATALVPGLPRHQAFMAIENRFSLAVNVGSDGDLSANWIFLDPQAFGVEGVGNSGLCPFARYDPVTAHYYVAGGGADINLGRSTNLSRGSWQQPPAGPAIEVGCAKLEEDCSPSSDVARIADGFFTQFWANGSDHGARAFLKNLTAWDFSVNDADACDNGTHTFFIYGQCAQTAPKNFTGKSGYFYQLGIAPGPTSEWMSSYYN
jgi:hypothetical protein